MSQNPTVTAPGARRPASADRVFAGHVAPPSAEESAAVDSPRGKKWRWFRWAALWSMPAWLISMLFHMFGVSMLVVVTLGPPELPNAVNLVATHDEQAEEALEEMEFEVVQELELQEFETAAPQVLSETFEVSAMELDPSMTGALSLSDMVAPQSVAFDGLTADGLMSELDGLGDDAGRMATFFGTGAAGRRIVFLVDNSGSMTEGRMETALIELNKAVEKLSPKQKFYIIFFSDMAYPLFYPSYATEMVPANKKNKQLVAQWLRTIPMCWKTDGKEAFALALQMKPDLIYILGDGAINDQADKDLINTSLPGITIHTMGMQVKAAEAKRFAAVAAAHNGTYKDVGVTDEGKAMLKQYGEIPRYKEPTGVWGLKLKKK